MNDILCSMTGKISLEAYIELRESLGLSCKQDHHIHYRHHRNLYDIVDKSGEFFSLAFVGESDTQYHTTCYEIDKESGSIGDLCDHIVEEVAQCEEPIEWGWMLIHIRND